MANKIKLARGTKARIETIKGTLETNEIVYATDTNELGVKKADGNIEYFMNATDIDDKVVTLTDAQTISGAKTFSRQVKITHPGFNPSLVLESDAHVTNASGSIMADMIRGRVTNDNGKTSNMFIIGTYGVEEFGGIPRPHYMYLDSRIDGTYDNATLKVDAENRIGVATGSSRPTEALDVGGKIRMRTQTVTGDDDTIVVTKGYMDAAINTLNHDIVIIPDTAFTITQAHFNKTLIITSSSDVTITVPTKIVEDIEKGFFCDIIRYGTGEVTFSGAGIVLNSAGPLSIDAQYIAASLIKIDNNNEWLLIGGIETGLELNAVTSVAGKTGAVVLAKADVGLSNLQNYTIASKIQAEAGTANNLYMTPLRTKELITNVMGDIESALTAILGV